MSAHAPSARLDSLTGARFAAALCVFIFHACKMYRGDGFFGKTLTVLGLHGSIGVDFFFVLSGFVLAWSWRQDDSYAAFMRRRFARIAPAYWVALLYGLVWTLSYSKAPWTEVARATPAVMGLQAWFPQADIRFAANGVEWSVSAEAFFYALFPVLIVLAARRRGFVALAGAALLLGLLLPEVLARTMQGDVASWLVNQAPAFKIGEFLCGLLLAVGMRRGLRSVVPVPLSLVLFALCYLVLPYAPTWLPGRALSLLAVLAVVAALAQRDIDGRGSWFAHRIPVRLGVWSYCFYLVHQVTLDISRAALSSAVTGPAYGPVWLILSLLATISLAILLYEYVERPGERRLRGSTRDRVVIPVAALHRARRHRPFGTVRTTSSEWSPRPEASLETR